jgi:hypothetical protein
MNQVIKEQQLLEFDQHADGLWKLSQLIVRSLEKFKVSQLADTRWENTDFVIVNVQLRKERVVIEQARRQRAKPLATQVQAVPVLPQVLQKWQCSIPLF